MTTTPQKLLPAIGMTHRKPIAFIISMDNVADAADRETAEDCIRTLGGPCYGLREEIKANRDRLDRRLEQQQRGRK
jgi:hypothetical protein